MVVSTYATVARRENPISKQPDDYRVLVKKLIQLAPNYWPMFQEQLKNLHSAEIHQIEEQKNWQEANKKIEWNNQSQKQTYAKSTAQSEITL